MFCPKCGELLPDGSRKCPVCGARVGKHARKAPEFTTFTSGPSYEQPVGEDPEDSYDHTHYQCDEDDCTQVNFSCEHSHSAESVDFKTAITLFFQRYSDFNGRSRRSEYWWAMLMLCIGSAVFSTLSATLANLWWLLTLVPNIAVSVRRLHDIGKPGIWYLFMLIPLAGPIILLIQMVKDSAPANQWGPSPKY